MRLRRRVLQGLLLAMALVGLAACGQKGPLYLPHPSHPPQQTAPPQGG